MRYDLNSLLKEQMVDRFEEIVKHEIHNHNQAIRKTADAIALMEETLQSVKDDYIKLKNRNDEIYHEVTRRFDSEKESLEKLFQEHKIGVFSNLELMNNQALALAYKLENYVPVKEFAAEKVSQDKKIDFQAQLIQKHFESCHKQLEVTLEEIERKLEENYKNIGQQLQSFSAKLSNLESRLEIFKVDASGVLKELQVYKKAMYIIEKKIENIYTLIERLQQREGSCHSKA
jgi:hypothetical protein